MDSKTLDQRLRERGAHDLKEELSNAFARIRNGICTEDHQYCRRTSEGLTLYEGVTVLQALRRIEELTYEHLKPYAEEKEVIRFLRKVEAVSQDVEALKEGLSE